MSAESPRHMRSGGPLTVPSQPPPDRSIIDAVSGFINDVKLTSPTVDPKDVIQWARFETADINEPTSEGDSDTDISPLLLILGYGTGVQVWLIPPTGEAQEVLSWRQGTVRVLRILPSPNRGDCFTSKRPLIALCDSVSPGPSFCSLSFISIRGGEQVKSIKFKNPILDVLANKRSVVVSFSERFAVFDAATLEDRMAVTTCYPCPCPLGGSTPINPLALGERWLAYADKKLNPSKRSSGGCESEGQTSYTATVLHAAKSLGKGLRGLGESVAQSLAGTRAASQSPSPPHSDVMQPGVITVLDIEGIEEEDGQDAEDPCDPIVAHFVAHSEAVTALTFDASGLILVTADRRGHDFHVFRLNPHPCGPALAAVHHLYVLHRGDTTAKVQDISISCDCRWAAVSTLRGTTHVFAVAPYGGAAGVRTHTQARVVNRLSRFHRSAGLPIHCANKPASPVGEGAGAWFPNPRLPPYPQPALCSPLAQLRPTANLATHTITRTSSGRQRLSSLSEESGVGAAPLLARAAWGPAGAAGPGGTGPGARAGSHALYLMTAAGNLLHLLVHPRPANSVPKEKISDESPIEVEVEAVAQWALQRPAAAADLIAPLPPSNPLLQPAHCARCPDMCMSEEERWLAQVEIVTHAGPHRRLWMGPQFVFKTYNLTGSNSSLSEAEAVEVESVARSNPVNMPAAVPVLVDSGSASSLEQSPSDSFRRKSLVCEPRATSVCDVRLREDLAEAMKEDHGSCEAEAGPVCARGVARAVGPAGTVVRAAPNPAPARSDPDAYTRANADEATFRPVLNAPASLPPPALPASPLPATTTIPVQSVASDDLYALRPYTPPDDVYDSGDSVADVGRIQPVEALDAAKGRADETKMRVSASEEMLMELTSAAMESNHDSDIKPLKLEKQSQKEQLEAVVPPPKKISNVESVPEIKIVDAKVGKDKKSNSRSAKSYDSPVTKVKETKKEISESVKEIPEIKKEGSVKLDVSEPKKSEVKGAKKELSESLKEIPEFKKEGSVRRGVSDTKKQVKETKKDSCDKKRDAIEIKIAPSEQNEVSESKKSAAAIKKEFRESKIEVFTEQIAAKKEASESKKEATIKKVVAETKPVTSLVTEALKEVERKKYIEKDSLETSISNKVTTGFKKSPEKDILQLDKNELLEKKDSAEFKSKKDKSAMKSMNFSPESKQPQKNNSERESSLKRETADLKSSWKRESKLDWSIKSDSNEKPTVSKELDVIKAPEEQHVVEIKTEDQAWDMLLNEPEKSVSTLNPQTVATDKTDESKSKSKKNRKLKKSLDEAQSKSEDDSFVEIHAIEDKIQPSSGELVSISMPYEEIESSSSYSSKTKKSRSPKNSTDKKQQPKLDDWSIEDIGCDNKTTTCKKKSISSEIDILLGYDSESIQKVDTDCIKLEGFESIATDSSTKDKKTKAFVSNQETYISYEKSLEVDVKDVYVIDSTKEEFPEIQITSVRGNKMRKKSPQLEIIKKTEDKEIVSEIPIKSWSAIAASKNTKKTDEPDKVRPTEPINIEKKLEYKEKDIKNESKVGKKSKPSRYDVDDEPSSPLSLHEELMRLCKRTDIMVAECDAPSELNFVEEHHSLLQDLPPLDLDFGMDDFNLEVMRDSLLEVNDTKISSPICKIDIDSILSSIKESTSAFNLIDLEKVPDKKEKGFSVVENDKIRSEEVIADDDKSDEKEIEAMEKSSDDDNTSPASADSEKDENKTGASNLTLPSTKQSSKSKKSRRKKK